ncbi:MAG: archaeosortase/exosortase family protein [Candidatus Aenigmatarchaeota archaeon]
MNLKKMEKHNPQMWKTLIFFSRLVVLSIPVYLVITLGVDLIVLQNTVADNSYLMFKYTGFAVAKEGPALTVGLDDETRQPFYFIISEDSTGWKSLLFFGALLLAVPEIHNRKRMWGLIIGLPVIWIGNLVRIYVIVMVERSYGFQAAAITHDYLWQVGLMILVLATWLLWYAKVTEKFQKKSELRI